VLSIWDDQDRLSVITTPKNFRDVTEGMGYLPMTKFRIGLCFLRVIRILLVFVAFRCKELVEVHEQMASISFWKSSRSWLFLIGLYRTISSA